MKNRETAVLAGGCFWCLQKVFDETYGVIETECGYSGGSLKNPSYEKVCSGIGGHYETLKIIYDPLKISYSEILKIFWSNIDAGNPDGQFCDIGKQYETVIFFMNQQQKLIAEKQKEILNECKIFKEGIKTKILPFYSFYKAEEYHQKYYKKYPKEYEFYYTNSGRSELKHISKKIEKCLSELKE